MKKVFVTGMGVVTSLGNSPEELMAALRADKTGVRSFPEWEKYNGLHCYLGAPTQPYDIKSIADRKARRTMSTMSEMALVATKQAMSQAGMETPDERTLLIMGSTTGSPKIFEEYFTRFVERHGPEGQLSSTFFKTMNHSVAANVAVGLGLLCPVLSPGAACATSSQAIVMGWELLQTGLYDRIIAGGADEMNYQTAAVFDNVMAASRGFNDRPELSPRPFDADRDGLVVSEGSGMVILETEGALGNRTALAELKGGAYMVDGSHISQPKSNSMAATMRQALQRSNVEAEAVGYVNAHATGTLIGDVEEANATRSVVGEKTPVSSLKGHLGHSMAACGAVEVIASIEMMRSGVLVGTRNLQRPDEKIQPLQVFSGELPASVKTVMSNNFAFGGMNTSVVLSSAEI